jgi:hypothetical protein
MRKMLAAAVAAMSLFTFESAAIDKFGPPAELAAKEGRLEAERDIREGRLILRTYGFAGGAPTPAAAQLYKRYGIRSEAVAGCVVNPAIIAETAAYNEVMKAEIRKRFGEKALDELEGPNPRSQR